MTEKTEPIALYLIGGFLGAGKTTFLHTLLAELRGQRIGLLVNEFGSVGVDGALLREGEIQLVEINRGSIFCACLKDGFVRTLKAFSQQPIDILLIENSGMADPSSMSTLLDHLSPYLTRSFAYKGMVCLVDSTTFLGYATVLMPVQNQVIAADLLVVNKTDLVDGDRLKEIQTALRALNQEATIYETTYAKVPYALIQRDLLCHGKVAESANTPWNRPATYTLTSGEAPATREQTLAFCAALCAHVLRMKGFLPTTGGWLHVETVSDQIAVTDQKETADIQRMGGTLVIIGKTAEDLKAVVLDAWESAFHMPVRLEEC